METTDTTTEPPATEAEEAIQRFFHSVMEMAETVEKMDLTHAKFKAPDGRIFSAAAVMRIIDRQINFIRIRMGGEYRLSQQNSTHKPRG